MMRSITGEAYRLVADGVLPSFGRCTCPSTPGWLNQVEICFSILQRKVLTPPETKSLAGRAAIILGFQASYEELARPFEWKFTRNDLAKLLARLAA